MTKPDLIICLPDFDNIPADRHNEAKAMQCTLVDYSGRKRVEKSRRMGHEKKVEAAVADPNFPEAPTHQRLGPWLIQGKSRESYEPPALMSSCHEYDAIYTFKFIWQPLPESENPWTRIPATSFSGLPDHLGKVA